jgi:hypothetical protein
MGKVNPNNAVGIIGGRVVSGEMIVSKNRQPEILASSLWIFFGCSL